MKQVVMRNLRLALGRAASNHGSRSASGDRSRLGSEPLSPRTRGTRRHPGRWRRKPPADPPASPAGDNAWRDRQPGLGSAWHLARRQSVARQARCAACVASRGARAAPLRHVAPTPTAARVREGRPGGASHLGLGLGVAVGSADLLDDVPGGGALGGRATVARLLGVLDSALHRLLRWPHSARENPGTIAAAWGVACTTRGRCRAARAAERWPGKPQPATA